MKIIVVISFALLLCGCSKKDDELYSIGNAQSAPIAELISITGITKTTLEADNATISTITIKVHPETDTLARTVTISTSVGTFLNGKTSDVIKADAYGNATVSLISSIPGLAVFSAKIKSWNIDTTLSFTPSLPDDMLFSADNTVVDANASVSLTDLLSRNPFRGSVSDPCKVFFVITGTGNTSLVYPAFSFSSDKKATAIVTNPTHIKGNFQVEAKTLSSKGDTLRRFVNLTIQ